jgi:7,8-dihydropterin-6-yl-methyl-4-(beta-D-ribofuranosyl)aminobenzene 5'-phosphate synthase
MQPRRHLLATCSVLLIAALLAACGSQTAAPTAAPVPQASIPGATAPAEDLAPGDFKLTIVYDNTTTDPQLSPDWGFAAVVETGGHTLLFDTGAKGSNLLHNLQQLGVDPAFIEAIILSHQHDDHTGGLQALLATGVRPTVYVPAKFTRAFKRSVEAQTTLVEVSDAVEIVPGVHTTRPIGSIIEEALVVETGDGAVVITGCAHPGVVEIVREAQAVTNSPIALVVGGFHLASASESQVSSIIAELRQLGVQKVMPCHCTGEKAIAVFRSEYGEDFVEGGVGRTVAVTGQ